MVVSDDEIEFGCGYGLVRDLVQITMTKVLYKTSFGVVSFKPLSPSVWRWWLFRFVVMLCFGLLMRLFSFSLFTVHVCGFQYCSFFLLLQSDPDLSEGGEEDNLAVMVDL